MNVITVTALVMSATVFFLCFFLSNRCKQNELVYYYLHIVYAAFGHQQVCTYVQQHIMYGNKVCSEVEKKLSFRIDSTNKI